MPPRVRGRKALFDRLSGVFDNAGIEQRHIVAPPEWYEHPHGWRDRNAIYLEASEDLFIEAASTAIEEAGLTPDDIDGVVTVSTTGIATPSLEARVGPRSAFATTSAGFPFSGSVALAESTDLPRLRGSPPRNRAPTGCL